MMAERVEHVCPWWLAYTFDNPLRKLVQKPERMMGGLVKPGMTVLDVGCGMGYFSLGLARLVGPTGLVVSVDVQQKMLSIMHKRADKAGLAERIQPRLCQSTYLGLDDLAGKIDFALNFYMVHEVPDIPGFLGQMHQALAPKGLYLISEPAMHVTADMFKDTEKMVEAAGFAVTYRPHITLSRSLLLVKA